MKQVLLIDASDMFRDYIKSKLTDEKIAVEIASGNRDAYTKMTTLLPDLIIVDIEESLEGLHDFLAKKYDDPNTRNIPMIISGPTIPRSHAANLARFGVVKYFAKPIKFDYFFESISKILSIRLTMDDTPCILETHINGSIIFIEVAQGLNREKISILKFKLSELIDSNNLQDPRIVLMMTNLDLSFIDGSNLEMLIDNISSDKRISHKHIKILSLNPFVKELVEGHEEYQDIEVASDLTAVLNSIVETNNTGDINDLVTTRILSSKEDAAAATIEMRFGQDSDSAGTDEDKGKFFSVALVDDDPLVLKIMQNAFQAFTSDIKCYTTGAEFMKEVDSTTIDLLILDIFIPDINGYDILRNLQQRNFKAPILIYSQATMREAVIQALSLGARSYLVKPQKPNVIVEKALEILNTRS